MTSLRVSMLLTTLLFAAACGAEICPDGSRAPCQDPAANADADTSQGSCAEPGFLECSGTCVDTDISADHCGMCGRACDQGMGCASGECVPVCDGNQVLCGDDCIDPQTDLDHCGASGTCTGVNAGTDCGDGETCAAGVCTPALTYVGSLQATNGRWNYAGQVGLNAANQECKNLYGTVASVCTFAKLTLAESRGELVGAKDNLNNPVDTWFVYDAAATGSARQCVNTAGENLPWTYQTAHLGQGAKYVQLTNATGDLGDLLDGAPGGAGCQATRFVPCCN